MLYCPSVLMMVAVVTAGDSTMPAGMLNDRLKLLPLHVERKVQHAWQVLAAQTGAVPITAAVVRAVPALADAAGGLMVLLAVQPKGELLHSTWSAHVGLVDALGHGCTRGIKGSSLGQAAIHAANDVATFRGDVRAARRSAVAQGMPDQSPRDLSGDSRLLATWARGLEHRLCADGAASLGFAAGMWAAGGWFQSPAAALSMPSTPAALRAEVDRVEREIATLTAQREAGRQQAPPVGLAGAAAGSPPIVPMVALASVAGPSPHGSRPRGDGSDPGSRRSGSRESHRSRSSQASVTLALAGVVARLVSAGVPERVAQVLARQGVVAERLQSYGIEAISAALEDHVALSAIERLSLSLALGAGSHAPAAYSPMAPQPPVPPPSVPAPAAPPAPAPAPAPSPPPVMGAAVGSTVPRAPLTIDECRRAIVGGGHAHRMPGSVQSLAFYQQLWRECIGSLFAYPSPGVAPSPTAVPPGPPVVPPVAPSAPPAPAAPPLAPVPPVPPVTLPTPPVPPVPPVPLPTPPVPPVPLPTLPPPPPSALPPAALPEASAAPAFQTALLATPGTRELFAQVPLAYVLEAVRHCCEAMGVSLTASAGMVVPILGARIAQAFATANVRAGQAVQRAIDGGCPPEGVPGVVLAQLPPASGTGGAMRAAAASSGGGRAASGGALEAATQAAARIAAKPADLQAIDFLHTLSGESGSDGRLRAQVATLSLDAGMGADLCLLLAQENLESVKSGVLAALDPLASRVYALVIDVRERLLGARGRHYEHLFSPTGTASSVAKLVEAAAAGKLTSELVVGKQLSSFAMLCAWAPLAALVQESSPRDPTAAQAMLAMHAEAFGRGSTVQDLSIELAITPVFAAYTAEFARYARGGLATATTWASVREQVEQRSGRAALLRMSAVAAREGGAGRDADPAKAAEAARKVKAAKEREDREEAKKAKEAGAAAAASGAPAAAAPAAAAKK